MPRVALLLIAASFTTAVAGTAHAFALRKTESGQHVRWRDKRVPLRVDQSLKAAMGGQAAYEAAVMAAEAWRGLPGVPEIVIERGAPAHYRRERRGNGIYLISPWPYRAHQLALTVSTVAPDGEMLGVDVLINGDHPFALLDEQGAAGNYNDLGAVLAHEFGHVLGLDESPEHEMATMYPFIRTGEVHQRTLEHDDEEGAIAAYSTALPEVACAAAYPGRHAGSPLGAGILLALGLVLHSRLRRARSSATNRASFN